MIKSVAYFNSSGEIIYVALLSKGSISYHHEENKMVSVFAVIPSLLGLYSCTHNFISLHIMCQMLISTFGTEVLFSLHRFCSFPRFCKQSIPEEGAESYSPSLTKKHGKTEAIPPKQLCRPQSTGKRIKNQPLCDSQSG